jgi:hypothetical protein
MPSIGPSGTVSVLIRTAADTLTGGLAAVHAAHSQEAQCIHFTSGRPAPKDVAAEGAAPRHVFLCALLPGESESDRSAIMTRLYMDELSRLSADKDDQAHW